MTGLLDVVSEGEQALLFFNVGSPFVLFHRGETKWRKVPSTQWNDVFARPNGQAAIIPLGGDALRMCLLALEAGAGESEEVLLRPAGFKLYLENVQTRDAATLIWVREEALQGFILVPGRKLPLRDALVFSPAGQKSDADALSMLFKLDDRLLRISQFEFSEFPPFLQEYALRVVFLLLAEPALKRFEQLAGDTLMEALSQEVNRFAFHQGWKIQFFGERVQHRQYFQDVSEAAAVYRSFFRVLKQYAIRVVGAALAGSMAAEGVDSLPATYREILESRNFLVG